LHAIYFSSAYLQNEPDHNVIRVDWGKLNGGYSNVSRDLLGVSQIAILYNRAVKSVERVASHIAQLIHLLHEQKGVSYEHIHVIGHSLGGKYKKQNNLIIQN